MNARVCAVVPAHNPVLADVVSLVRSLRDSHLPVLVVDDGSDDTDFLEACAGQGASTFRYEINQGIARSLNKGLAFARSVNASWLLTVDQDTVLPNGYVKALLGFAHTRAGVIGAETIGDVSGDLRYSAREVAGHLITDEVFQTGSLWRVNALSALGGFDESLGMDAVDAEACLKLREAGFAVVLARDVRLSHRYGSGHAVRLLGRSIVATGHSPARRETMVRNRLRLFPREFRQSPIHALRTLRRLSVNVILGVTVEEDRWAKARATWRGACTTAARETARPGIPPNSPS